MSRERAKELGIEPVETVDAMLPRVDYLTVHTPLDRRNPRPDRRGTDREDEAGRAADQRGPRRHLRRSGAGRGAQVGQDRRRGARRVRHRAMHRQPAVRHAGRRLHAALGREHRGGPNAGRRRSGRVDRRLSDDRRDPARGERGVARSARRWHRCAVISTSPTAWACCWPAWSRAGCGRAACCIAAKSRRKKPRCSPPCSPPGCCRARSIRK